MVWNHCPMVGSSLLVSTLLILTVIFLSLITYLHLYSNRQAKPSLYRTSSTRLRPGSKDIRILHLHPGSHEEEISCSLRVVSLHTQPAPDYEALSYVWGDETITATVKVDGLKVQATVNLVAALRHIRRSDENVVLWVDVICIDQSDTNEKGHQVAMMTEIYLRCSQVIIWLGCCAKSGNDEQDPFGFLCHFRGDAHIASLPGFSKRISGEMAYKTDTSFEQLHSAFQKVVTSEWWVRLWTLQEIVLPRRGTLMLGHWTMDLLEMISTVDVLSHHVVSCCAETNRLLNAVASMHDTFDFVTSLIQIWDTRREFRRRKEFRLDAILLKYNHRRCRDPLDRIYAMLAFLSLDHYGALVPNYSLSKEALFISTTRALIEGPEGLECLCRMPRFPAQHGLPTWAREFGTVNQETVNDEAYRIEYYNLYCSSRNSVSRKTFLESNGLLLQGIRIGKVAMMGDESFPLRDHRSTVSVRTVLSLWHRVAFGASSETRGSLSLGSFWRTLVAGVLKKATRKPVTLKHRLCRSQDRSTFEKLEQWLLSQAQDAPQLEYKLWRAILDACTSRTFFLTNDGRPGLCYPHTQRGDEIWICAGSNMPFVLRPCIREKSDPPKARTFNLIGACYVDGLMHGIAFPKMKRNLKGVILR